MTKYWHPYLASVRKNNWVIQYERCTLLGVFKWHELLFLGKESAKPCVEYYFTLFTLAYFQLVIQEAVRPGLNIATFGYLRHFYFFFGVFVTSLAEYSDGKTLLIAEHMRIDARKSDWPQNILWLSGPWRNSETEKGNPNKTKIASNENGSTYA